MDDVHRDIELLQILEQSPMIVSSHFQERLNLGQWHIGLDTIDKGTKAFPRVVKSQSRAMFKALVSGE